MNKDLHGNKIGEVNDSDFGLEIKEMKDPKTRHGARGLVFDENNKIAVFNKQLKNEFKLPGGGIDDGEEPEEAFKRECLEELGCEVQNISQLGIIEENQSQENFRQCSFVFVAQKHGELKSTNLTQKELDEGSRFVWLSLEEALEKMKSSLAILKESKYDSVYRTKFMVTRDIKILEYYIKQMEK